MQSTFGSIVVTLCNSLILRPCRQAQTQKIFAEEEKEEGSCHEAGVAGSLRYTVRSIESLGYPHFHFFSFHPIFSTNRRRKQSLRRISYPKTSSHKYLLVFHGSFPNSPLTPHRSDAGATGPTYAHERFARAAVSLGIPETARSEPAVASCARKRMLYTIPVLCNLPNACTMLFSDEHLALRGTLSVSAEAMKLGITYHDFVALESEVYDTTGSISAPGFHRL